MLTFFKKLGMFLKSKWIISVAGLIILIVIIHAIFFRHTSTYQFVTVTRGPITESVSLTGNTTPKQSVALTFGSTGIVSQTYSDLGKQVTTGQILAELNMSDLLAQLHTAEAALVIAQSSTANNTINIANITAQQDALVANAYRTLLSSNLQAIPNDLNSSAPASPLISGSYSGPEGNYVIHFYSAAGNSGVAFDVSGLETGGAEPVSANTTVPIGTHGLYVTFGSSVNNYINSANTDWTISIPNTKSATYTANDNAYIAAQVTHDQVIAQAQASVGTSATNQSVAEAQIAEAQASVDSANAKIQNAEIIAPISGTVTQFDAKVGQLASENTPLVSIMSDGGYEVDCGVSETDIGKISLGNAVTMTLDAFPGETFTGSVFYIAPAETNTAGVISYQVKIAFTASDVRLKSGLTANITIQTKQKDAVLILPEYAILQNDQGTFVETLVNNQIKQNPVTLGIADQKGNVEITSGVTEGEQVVNIGLKA